MECPDRRGIRGPPRWRKRTVAEADDRQADAVAVICPSHLLGPLAERRPDRRPFREKSRATRPWADFFALLRTREAAWGDESAGRALRLARADSATTGPIFWRNWAASRRKPGPSTRNWPNCSTTIGPPTAGGKAGWAGTVEPLGPGWAGLVLLARAAPYAKHRDNYSTLFDINTMEPLVAGPPFVRALEELVAAAKLGSPEQLQYDPAAARAAFWQGRCGMALTWPTAALDRPGTPDPAETTPVARSGDRPQQGGPLRVGFAELPGAMQVYNIGGKSWEDRPEGGEPHVPLLGVAGRIGVVGGKSEHPEAALELLLWLSGQQWGVRVSAVSPATTLFRRSQAESPREWVEKPVSGPAAAAYAAQTEQTFQRQESVMALRLPGRAEYLAALDEAVQAAVRGQRSAAEAPPASRRPLAGDHPPSGNRPAEKGLPAQPGTGVIVGQENCKVARKGVRSMFSPLRFNQKTASCGRKMDQTPDFAVLLDCQPAADTLRWWDGFRGGSSVGRARQSHCRGREFDPPPLHMPAPGSPPLPGVLALMVLQPVASLAKRKTEETAGILGLG